MRNFPFNWAIILPSSELSLWTVTVTGICWTKFLSRYTSYDFKIIDFLNIIHPPVSYLFI
jgi:hypothetical protein